MAINYLIFLFNYMKAKVILNFNLYLIFLPISSRPPIFFIEFLAKDSISRFLMFGRLTIFSMQFEDKES